MVTRFASLNPWHFSHGKLGTGRRHGHSALSLAVGLALAAPMGLQAQNAANKSDELQEIVVTGFRASLESAIAAKQANSSIVEVVSAEDIGKLPDTSIAEAISRLPGLTSQRAEGRASAISLRGTDPGFSTALLNGREQVSTGDNRSVEFDQYPSELLNSVVVYKTPDAALVGQGLAGTIDLRTVRPLDYGRRAVALNLRREMNSNDNLGADSKDNGYRASFSYIGQFADDTIGLAFGYARLDSPLATRAFGTYEPWEDVAGNQWAPGLNAGIAAGTRITKGMKVRSDMGSTIRDGMMGVLQFKPSDTYNGTIDVYYSTMDQTNNARSLEVNLGGYPGPCCDGAFPPGTPFGYQGVTITNNTVVAGTLRNVVPLARNFLFTTEDEIIAGGFRNEFTLSDTWSMVADISYSKATREQDQFEINAQYKPINAAAGAPRNVYDTGTFTLRGASNMPSLSFTRNYADAAQVQVGPTIYGAGYTKAPETEDDLSSVRFDVSRNAELGWFSKVTGSLNYADRTKDKRSPEAGLGTKGDAYFAVQSQYLLAPMNLGYAGAGQALAWDVKGVLGAYYNPISYGTPETLPYLAPKFWTVDEKTWTGSLRGELDNEISGSVTLKGSVGVQIIRTDQSSSSFLAANAYGPAQQILRVGDGKTYTDYLPQINLAFVMSDNQAVRFGLAREMARPRMDQLKATEESGYDRATGKPGGSGGNPRLDPWRAWALDLSYERYFEERKGYVSAAAFYKKLSTYIYNQTTSGYDFTNLFNATPASFFAPGIAKQRTGDFTRPVNGSGGTLWGLEFAASVPFEMFAPSLDGFGAVASYSYTDSNIAVRGSISSLPAGNIPLPGLSDNVWSATLYYEKHGFSARVAGRYRSEYIGEVTNFANERGFRYVQDDMIVDAQLSYEFGEGSLKGLQVLVQANNLTNEPYIAYSQIEDRVLDFQEYGSQYLFGLNYRF